MISFLSFLYAEYLIQVDLEEERENQETNARQEFDKGELKAKTVPQLLEKLSSPGQMPLFYSGGLEILSQAVTDGEDSSGRSFAQLSSLSNLFVPTLSPITCFTGPPVPSFMAKVIARDQALRAGWLRRL